MVGAVAWGHCAYEPVSRIVEGHVQMDREFDRECAGILAKRGVKQLEDGTYQFTRDKRVIAVRMFIKS